MFRDEIRWSVRSYELDFYQHVNHAVYASWMEEARNRYLTARGRSYADYPESLGLWIVVVSSHLEYRASAVAGDEIRIRTHIERVGRTSVTFLHEVDRLPEEKRLVDGRVVMVFKGRDGRAAAVPAELRSED
ncbi:MAG: thioesterase family protein [Planctomycetota bacterium]